MEWNARKAKHNNPMKLPRRSRSFLDAKTAVQDLASMAESYGMRSVELTDRFISLRDRFNLSGRDWTYLSGYLDSRRDSWYRTHLVFRYKLDDGRLVEFDPAMPESEKAQITKENPHSGHYWERSMRPFFTSDDKA